MATNREEIPEDLGELVKKAKENNLFANSPSSEDLIDTTKFTEEENPFLDDEDDTLGGKTPALAAKASSLDQSWDTERYEILETVGEGGMGIVYKAQDLIFERIVALKVMKASQDQQLVKRFFQEGKISAKLSSHPGIVTIYGFERFQNRYCILMEFIEGIALDKYLQQNKLSILDKTHLFIQIAEALVFAHQAGIIHRDLKPSNILIDPRGFPHLTDFGIAKDLNSIEELSVLGGIAGTREYMSPEQVEASRKADSRMDQFSLGVIFYEMLTNKLPIEEKGPSIFYKIVHDVPKIPSYHKKEIPSQLDTICMKLLQKKPEDRYGSMMELVQELKQFQNKFLNRAPEKKEIKATEEDVALIKLLQELRGKDREKREKAALALGKLEKKESVSALVTALADEDVKVRIASAYALWKIERNTKNVIPVLVQILKEKDKYRQISILTLGKIGKAAKEAVPALVETLKDKDVKVLVSAAYALSEIENNTKDTFPVLIQVLQKEEKAICENVVYALAKMGKKIIPDLLQSLELKNENVRFWIIHVFYQLGKEATSALAEISRIAEKDESKRIRKIAAETIKKIKK